MVSLDDLKELLLYKKQFFLPIDPKDKKHGSAIMLLAPSFQSSMLAMTAPYTINRHYFESYYVEKAITRFIQNESVYSTEDPGEYIIQEAMTTAERNGLKDSDFGLPEQRKYPLNDQEHILLAIRFFNYCPKADKDELAKNILKAIGEKFDGGELLNINVGKNNAFRPYWENSEYYKRIHKDEEEKKEVEESTELSFSDRSYLMEFVSPSAVQTINRRMTHPSKVFFNGYNRDIHAVQSYIKSDYIDSCFDRLNLEPPKKVTITCCNDAEVDEVFTKDSVLVYTPFAFAQKSTVATYEDYIKYILQLFAIHTLRQPKGVNPGLAEPAAILLSGIADKKIEDGDKNFEAERFIQFIIDEEGIDGLVSILRWNSMNELNSLLKKFGKSRFQEKNFFEQMDLVREVAEYDDREDQPSSLNNEPKAEMPDISDPVPQSIKDIQNMGTKLKRRIRQHSVYKLNKLKRDIERGNVGVETRGPNTLQLLQYGQLSNINSTMNTESTKLSEFNRMTDGDYIRSGNTAYLFEASDRYDIALRRALFKDRFKSSSQVLDIYKKVKAELPFIKFAFIDVPRYQNRNLFIDLSYYNESFFRNVTELNPEDRNNTIRIFKTYLELMERLLKYDKFSSYSKKTIFIPVLDWHHNNSHRMWMYKEDINPISAIYYLMKFDLPTLKRVFGNRDVVFLGGKNYFKVNFMNTDFSRGPNVAMFLRLIQRLLKLGYTSADPDPEGELEDSPTGIAMDIVDKIETSQNVSIDNVSRFAVLKKATDLITPTPTAVDVELPPTAVKKDAIEITASKLSGDITTVPVARKLDVRDHSNSIRGKMVKVPVEVGKKVVTKAEIKAATSMPSDNKAVNTTSENDKKEAIVQMIADVADKATSVDDALDRLDSDSFKNMVLALQNDSEENVRVDRTRASAVVAMQDEFHKKEIAGRSVKDILSEDRSEEQIKKTALKVSSINNDWQNLTFMNFDKDYDPNTDIIKMLDSMQNWTFPVAVKNVDIKDNSTSEDVLDLWTIECVDFKNTRFTLKVDVPKFIDGSNFLKLRGNEKTLMIQSALLPIIKTNLQECQIIGSGGYNKIFVRLFGSRRGQSMPAANGIIRAINKYLKSNGTDIKVVFGDSGKVCAKYELPIDYIDLAQVFDTIECNGLKLYFNQDVLRSEYEVDDKKGIPIGIKTVYNKDTNKGTETVLYYGKGDSNSTISAAIAGHLSECSPDFFRIYNDLTFGGSKYTYTKASILNSEIPVIIVCGYLEGLIKTMNKAGIKYSFVESIDRTVAHNDKYDYIRFSDGYLQYEVTYSSALLMNGLKENDTESYSIKDVNNRRMYFEFLENYGGSLHADGLENSYDCMIDPITKEILERYKLPTDYVGVLVQANNMLADNKYVKHTDQSGRRWRRKELIAGYFYKALSKSYEEYANAIRHTKKNVKMAMKQSAIIDLLVSKDPATSDLSVNNALNDVECTNSVTNKGLVGMNVARGYTINTRGYDDSMLNLLGMDTGFSGNVGINRQATVNANIEGGRGFVKTIDGDTDKMSSAASFTMTEAVTPFGSTHDDPPRTLMTYVQTSKHMIRCENNDPLLVTTGADEAMPYMTSDIFAYKAKDDGVIKEMVQEGFGKRNYMVVEYKNGNHAYINLSEEIKKNSDGGYYVPMKLDTDLKVGDKFKSGEILAYDKLSFSKSLGESGNLAANIGTLAKVAIINTDEGYEDSAAITESFANKIATEVVQSIDTRLEKGANVFVYKNIGDSVMEGDTLFAYQADFDDDVVNTLLKNLTMDADQLSELGRTPIKSKYTGIVADIQIYRTCDDQGMSPSLKAFVDQYENKIKDTKSVYDKYGIDASLLPKTGKVPEIGKTKNLDNAVLIVYYIKYSDKMSVGDKIVFYSANKGIIKYIIPKKDEPYTEFRPNEHVDSFMSLSSISGRMTTSIALYASTAKLMVELDRSIKDLAGIPYDDSKL